MKRVWDVVLPMFIGLLLGFSVWQGIQSHQLVLGVCALRADLESRVGQSKTFLQHHPHGAFGFSPATIRKGISDQERTIAALHVVSC